MKKTHCEKKFKKLLLMLLLLIPTISRTFSQELQPSRKNSAEELGIVSTRNYSGTEVQELINIVLEEADKSIENAYKEGYKQAAVEFKPEIEYWKQKYSAVQSAGLKTNIKYSLFGFGVGLGVGALSGICITLKY